VTIPSEVVVGLDVGTTAVKAVAVAPSTSWRRPRCAATPCIEELGDAVPLLSPRA
jgi:hypothetical protein